MDDLKSLTVRYLRELARKHLGKGYAQLKTKEELIAALKKAVPAALKAAAKTEPSAAKKTPEKRPEKPDKKAAKPAAREPAKPVAKPKPASPAKIVRFAKKVVDRSSDVTVPGKRPPASKAVLDSPRPAARAIPAVTPPFATGSFRLSTPARPPVTPPAPIARPAGSSGLTAATTRAPALTLSAPAVTARPASASPSAAFAVAAPVPVGKPLAGAAVPGFVIAPVASALAAAPSKANAFAPLVEGFFVARVVGEGEVRRHPLTEEQVRPVPAFVGVDYDEDLGDLPDTYGDESPVLLPRDPNTLFFFWDAASATRAAARSGLSNPRAVIRVFEGQVMVREVAFPLDSKGFYVHGLSAGRPYRAEAHFIGDDGRSQRVGSTSNEVTLPPHGPSPATQARFLRVPPAMPLTILLQHVREGRAQIEHLAGEPEYVPVVGFAPPGSQPWSFGAGPRPGAPRGQGGWYPPPSGRPF